MWNARPSPSLNHGNPIYVSDDFTLRLEYTDKASNNSSTNNTSNYFTFKMVTSAHRYLQGNPTFNLRVGDCTDGWLKIRTENNCGTSANFFTIPCEIIVPYYNISFDDRRGEITIRVVKPEVTQKAGVTNRNLSISKVEVYTGRGVKLFSDTKKEKTYEMKIDTRTWTSGEYRIVVSDNTYTQERRVIIE